MNWWISFLAGASIVGLGAKLWSIYGNHKNSLWQAEVLAELRGLREDLRAAAHMPSLPPAAAQEPAKQILHNLKKRLPVLQRRRTE